MLPNKHNILILGGGGWETGMENHPTLENEIAAFRENKEKSNKQNTSFFNCIDNFYSRSVSC